VRKIVIFGGGGFIGKTFARMFAPRLQQIVVIDRFNGPSHPRSDAKEQFESDLDRGVVQTIVADAAQAAEFGSVLADADAVLLLNADTGTANSLLTPHVCVRENVTTLLSETEAIRKFCRKDRTRVLFTSSRAVYGEGNWCCAEHGEVLLDRSAAALERKRFEPACPTCGRSVTLAGSVEHGRAVPLSVYGATKRSGEDLLRTVLAQDGFDVRTVRYQNVFGPGQEISNPYTGVLNWFSARLVRNEPVEIYERGHIRRDFIFVEDSARLLFALMTRERQSTSSMLIVNGGSGEAVPLADVAAILRRQYNSSSDILDCDKYRLGDVLGARADMERTERELGFRCSVTLEQGLARYAAWFKTQVQAAG
jgi:dTDP-L-rhamnose 4-epimerase